MVSMCRRMEADPRHTEIVGVGGQGHVIIVHNWIREREPDLAGDVRRQGQNCVQSRRDHRQHLDDGDPAVGGSAVSVSLSITSALVGSLHAGKPFELYSRAKLKRA